MADWTNISNAAVDGDSPVTQTLIESLRDNIVAVTEGATGAPKLQTAGIADGAVTNDKILDGTISPTKLYPAVVGDLVDGASISISSSTSDSYVKIKELSIVRSGNYRISFDLRNSAAPDTAYGRIYKNGVAIGTVRHTSSQTGVIYTEDINGLVTGDLIQLYIKNTGGYTTYNLSLTTGASFVYGANATL